MAFPDDLATLVPGLSVGTLDRSGRRLRWLTAGHGEPPILLVSGAGETSLDWLPVLPQLASVSTVVALDRAGLGLSPPDAGVSIQRQVDDVAAVLDHIGPAVVAGHSWGGLLVQLVAWRHPGSILGLVLVDPTHEDVFSAVPLHLRLLSRGLGPGLTLAHALGLFPRLARPMGRKLAELSTNDPELRSAIEAAYLQSYRHRYQVRMIGRENRLADGSRHLVRRARAEASPPDVPLIVLTATTGKPPALLSRSTALLAEVAAAAPRGRQILVENAGHYIHHDRPDAVVDAITTVVAEIRNQR
jgi:pimeloyl-ACP methyl ester carboxylesterase